MSLELLYKKMYGLKTKVFEYWAIYLISVIMNCVSDAEVIAERKSFITMMTDMTKSSIVILFFLTIFMLIFYILLSILKNYSLRQNISAKFTDIMRSYTEGADCPKIDSGISWGKNRTLWVAPNMVLGLKPEKVVLSHYYDDPYSFPAEVQNDFDKFEASDYMSDIRSLGNDLPRYMLSRYSPNFNKKNPLLSINIRKTSWGACQFVWNRYVGQEQAEEKQSEWRAQIIKEHFESGLKVIRYPNSLCLHLIIETSDGNVLFTEVSKEKKNDYPKSKAASIGEQLELSDFIDIKDYQENFVSEWVRRAICEEFGLSATMYESEFVDSSIRVLALDFEMDIYNFALVCTIKMKHDCEHFKKIVNATIEQKEISGMSEMNVSDIPGVLMNYKNNMKEYHPSTYIRLLLFYLYQFGFRRSFRTFTSCYKSFQSDKNL